MNGTVGSRIRWARQRRSLTLDKLADQTGISQSYLGRVENGSSNLTIPKLLQLATALEVGVDFLAIGVVAEKETANGIPPELSEMAVDHNLPFRTVLDLVRMVRIAQGKMNKEAWQEMYGCARLMADGKQV